MIDKQLLEDANAGNVEAQASLAALYNEYGGINEEYCILDRSGLYKRQ